MKRSPVVINVHAEAWTVEDILPDCSGCGLATMNQVRRELTL